MEVTTSSITQLPLSIRQLACARVIMNQFSNFFLKIMKTVAIFCNSLSICTCPLSSSLLSIPDIGFKCHRFPSNEIISRAHGIGPVAIYRKVIKILDWLVCTNAYTAHFFIGIVVYY